jgi:predicted dehydrogenase
MGMRKVGILGAGGMGRVHARHYAKFSDVELHFFDIDPERSDSYARDTGARRADSAAELIEMCDCIDVCLPTFLHSEFAELSIRAGKPTLCEKPLARTVRECSDLVDLSEKLGVLLMPGQVVRFFPEFRKANQMVKSGAVGKPSAIRTRRGGVYPKNAGAWMRDPELSGGVVLDLAVHDFDFIRWTFGEVRAVFSDSLTFSCLDDLDYSLTTLTLESGALAHVEATWADPGGFRVTFEIAGSEGLIEHDSRSTQTLRLASQGAAASESPLVPSDDPYYLQLSAFLEAAAGRAQAPVSALDGLRAVAIAEAAVKSARTGLPVAPSNS